MREFWHWLTLQEKCTLCHEIKWIWQLAYYTTECKKHCRPCVVCNPRVTTEYNPMTPKDLEFKAEDFEYLDVFGIVNFQPLADEANRLLRERLEKAPAVKLFSVGNGWFTCNASESDTHTARLVCIEEIKK